MTGAQITKAMILAAGLGTRMEDAGAGKPKPLVEVASRSLLDHALDRIEEAGINECVVNLHFRPDQVRARLDQRAAENQGPKVLYSDESDQLLDTGGGLKKALPLLGPGPFFVANADAIWRDTGEASISKLARAWDDNQMDALLLLHPLETALGASGNGDYALAADGRITRARSDPAPFLFTGLRLLHPRLFYGSPDGAFSILELFDRAESEGRLFGIVQDGMWMHVGTPDGLIAAEQALSHEATKTTEQGL